MDANRKPNFCQPQIIRIEYPSYSWSQGPSNNTALLSQTFPYAPHIDPKFIMASVKVRREIGEPDKKIKENNEELEKPKEVIVRVLPLNAHIHIAGCSPY